MAEQSRIPPFSRDGRMGRRRWAKVPDRIAQSRLLSRRLRSSLARRRVAARIHSVFRIRISGIGRAVGKASASVDRSLRVSLSTLAMTDLLASERLYDLLDRCRWRYRLQPHRVRERRWLATGGLWFRRFVVHGRAGQRHVCLPGAGVQRWRLRTVERTGGRRGRVAADHADRSVGRPHGAGIQAAV